MLKLAFNCLNAVRRKEDACHPFLSVKTLPIISLSAKDGTWHSWDINIRCSLCNHS